MFIIPTEFLPYNEIFLYNNINKVMKTYFSFILLQPMLPTSL